MNEEFQAQLEDLFSRTEKEIEALAEASNLGAVAFPTGMIMHYGQTRKWLQTMMDLFGTIDNSEGAEFIREEVTKIDFEVNFDKDTR